MPHEKLKPSFTIDEDRMDELKKVIPEMFADNQINWETLKEALGEYLEDEDTDAEHFGLFWPGKREARKIASIPSKGTLVPAPGEGINEDNTGNIFIEGENLEVLKLLQKSYAGKIKMIYIDPPYNTGNDFVYDDNFTEPIDEYLRRTGQIDEEGKAQTTNKKADGRFHSKWLSMMYPRIKLAKNLLTDDGVIFISIDDNELNNLNGLLNEVFGEENLIGIIIVKSNPRGSQSVKNIGIVHEYLLASCNDVSNIKSMGLPLNEKMRSEYSYKDENRERYRLLGLRQRGGAWRMTDRPNLFFPIFINPISNEISLVKNSDYEIEVLPIQPSTGIEGSWRWSKDKIKKDKKLLVGKKINRVGNKNAWDIFQIDYLKNENGIEKKTKAKTIWDDSELNYQEASKDLKQFFNNKNVFDFPKPTFLINRIMEMSSLDENDIVLDFMAGSCTTGHAVLSNIVEKKDKIQFMCIQLPERCDEDSAAYKAGYKTIAEIGKERLRKVIVDLDKDVTEEIKEKCGFKVFKLQKSNYKDWTDFGGTDLQQLEATFGEHESPLVNGWEEENLLTEILLMEGFPLASKVEENRQYKKNKVQAVSSDFCDHKLWVCLDKKVKDETINKLEMGDADIFICLDSAITDQNKVRLMDKGILKTI